MLDSYPEFLLLPEALSAHSCRRDGHSRRLPPDSTMRRPLTTRGCNCSSTKLTFLLTEVSLSELLEDERTDAKVRGGKDGRDEGREEMSKEDGEQS